MMKEVYNQYKKYFKYFLTNKAYIITIIIIAILSYGFAITNSSVGVDDLVQDRYITGTYLLSQGRWGNVLASRLFDITSFTPFWPEFIATILLVFIAVLLCTLVKKQIGNIVDKTIYYIIFSGIFLSYPIIHNIYIYSFANVIFGLSTIGMIIIAVIIYETTFNNMKCINIYACLCLIFPFFISMYEANCQTFLIIMLALCFMNLIKNTKTDKRIFKYVIRCIVILAIGIVLNVLINSIITKILTITGTLTNDFSSKATKWPYADIKTNLKLFKICVIDFLYTDIKNVGYICLFFIVSIITLIISTIKSFKRKNVLYILINIGIILVNFVIILIQRRVLYRTNTSWSVAIAFMILYIMLYFKKYNICGKIVVIVAGLLILYNSKALTLSFYNDYIRYEREKNIAYDIANTIIRTCEYPDKPLIYLPLKKSYIQGNIQNEDNGYPIIRWGMLAFDEKGVEITRFINSLGYKFTTANDEQYKEGYKEFMKKSDEYEKDFIIELENYIIVKVAIE